MREKLNDKKKRQEILMVNIFTWENLTVKISL